MSFVVNKRGFLDSLYCLISNVESIVTKYKNALFVLTNGSGFMIFYSKIDGVAVHSREAFSFNNFLHLPSLITGSQVPLNYRLHGCYNFHPFGYNFWLFKT